MPMLSVDDVLRCRAIEALLGVAGMGDLWTSLGPTRRARACRTDADLPEDERVMLSAAWALWDGTGAIRVASIDRLDATWAAALTELVLAFGRGATEVEAWLERYGDRPGARGVPARSAPIRR
jgi:hypothetical protein